MHASLYMFISMNVGLCACACVHTRARACVWLVRCVSDIQVFCALFSLLPYFISSWDLKIHLRILVHLELLYLTILVFPINPSIYISFFLHKSIFRKMSLLRRMNITIEITLLDKRFASFP